MWRAGGSLSLLEGGQEGPRLQQRLPVQMLVEEGPLEGPMPCGLGLCVSVWLGGSLGGLG